MKIDAANLAALRHRLSRMVRLANPRVRRPLALVYSCPVRWEDMTPAGEDRRHCGTCKKNVFNLVGKSEDEIEAAFAAGGDDLCAQVQVRADGTVVAGRCKEGHQRIRRGRIASPRHRR